MDIDNLSTYLPTYPTYLPTYLSPSQPTYLLPTYLTTTLTECDIFFLFQKAQTQLEEHEPKLTQLRRSSKEIKRLEQDSPAFENIQSRVSVVAQKQRLLRAKVDKKKSEMERDMENFRKFHEYLKNLENWLADVDTAELDKPISIEPDVVREQIHKNEVSLSLPAHIIPFLLLIVLLAYVIVASTIVAGPVLLSFCQVSMK